MKERQTNNLERLAYYKAKITQLENEIDLLREQLKLHNEAAEKILSMSDEQQEILFAMNKLFLDTYFVNFSTDDCRFVAATCTEKFTSKPRGNYDNILQEYVSNSVHKADRSMVSKFGSPLLCLYLPALVRQPVPMVPDAFNPFLDPSQRRPG